MNNQHQIEIRILGKVDGQDLLPQNYDLSKLTKILGSVEHILGRDSDR